ncbi:zf-HC2 domain-containing protein [Paeniglutamicibacter terrestris]|uniref:Zf-HC2 domain-containing protein n=1 Tax=Paeniglutamicibacter terrestris TaxID=2723403 RepID=A0ABX1G6Z7_9MICC|nr:anti-sigma factor [Arthrobacter sp. 7749]NKG21341.1 zf-HC2 domain-containing protein [Paeniglutamicibacter terrestris]
MNEHMDLGAYALGGLDPDEARDFEAHLAICQQCREELVSFAPVTTRLGALDTQAAQALLFAKPTVTVSDPGVELLDRLRARRRTRRALLGTAAVAAVAASVAGGVFLAPVLRPAPAPDASYEVVSAAGPRVDLGLNAKAWGTELQFSGTELPTSGTLSLWVVDRSGQVDRAGSWSATKTGTARLSGAVPTELGRISTIQLRDLDSRILAELSLPEGPAQLPG